MKKSNIKLFIAIIISLVIGAAGMYFFTITFGATTIINKSEKEVTVTDAGIADAVEKVYDSTVIVEVYKNNKLYGTGSGFIYEKDNDVYYVMTNNHVVSEATSVKIILSNGDSYETTKIGSDQYLDVAVLSFKSDKDIKAAEIGSSESMRVGDTVFTVGAPIDSNTYSWTVTRGILSGKDRMVSVSTSNSTVADYIMKSLQTDATINSGNSGGPLCNANGQIVGITNMKLVSSSIEGMSFAIPIEQALNYAKKLMKGEDTTRPTLGVQMADLSAASTLYYRYNIIIPDDVEEGVVVVKVVEKSDADKAGIEDGDIITKVENEKVTTMAELKYQLYQHNIGDNIKITLLRDGKEKTVEVKLTKSES